MYDNEPESSEYNTDSVTEHIIEELQIDESLFYAEEGYKIVEQEYNLGPLPAEIAELAFKVNKNYNKLNIRNWLCVTLKYSDDQLLKKYYQRGSHGSEIEFEATYETGGDRIFIEFFGTNSEFRADFRKRWDSISEIAKIE